MENVNLRAAAIHVIGDMIQSIGVLIAAIVIYFLPHWSIIDPICTFIFSVIVFFTTISVAKDCISVLMEGVPDSVDVDQLEKDLLKLEFVDSVHDIHVWALSMGKIALSAHISSSDPQRALKMATYICAETYKI